MLPQLEKAARVLAKASKILTEKLESVAEHDADLDVAALRAAVEEAMPRTAVAGAVATVEALVPEDDGSAEAAMREKLSLRYNTVRPFLSLLDESKALDPAPAGWRVLKAVRHLPALSRRRVKDRPPLPREVDADLVPAMWHRAVFSNAKPPQGAVDRNAYVVCVLQQLGPRSVLSAEAEGVAARVATGLFWQRQVRHALHRLHHRIGNRSSVSSTVRPQLALNARRFRCLRHCHRARTTAQIRRRTRTPGRHQGHRRPRLGPHACAGFGTGLTA